jgi:hypothetical protein
MKRLHIAGVLALACAAFVIGAAVDGSVALGPLQPPNLGAGKDADDAVRHAILSGSPVPRDISAIRRRLQKDLGGVLKTHIVANGGHEHPLRRNVMFMCFETYAGPMPGGRVDEGDLFFGYFLGPRGSRLVVEPGFVELIAWDRTKRRFNFWELIGTTWQFRGDSNDVLDNIRAVNTGAARADFFFPRKSPDGTPVLRCSGCHTLGAPIMKEIEAPHNDWWTEKHKLPPGAFVPDEETARLFQNATDAAHLAAEVKQSAQRLIDGRAEGGTGGQTLRQQLRSLFSTMEMNLVSDTVPFADRQARGTAVEVPAGFFADSRLASAMPSVPVDLAIYKDALTRVDSRFPSKGSSTRETRHAFLVPARSFIDNRVVDSLVKSGLLDDELVADVLAVDMATPVYSNRRAALIRFVPEKAANVSELRERLITALRAAPATDRGAQDLLVNLTDPARTAAAHRAAASVLVAVCVKDARAPETVEGWLRLAAQRRQAIEKAETAKHPQGVITERGFRVIFPIQAHRSTTPLELNPTSCRVEPRA